MTELSALAFVLEWCACSGQCGRELMGGRTMSDTSERDTEQSLTKFIKNEVENMGGVAQAINSGKCESFMRRVLDRFPDAEERSYTMLTPEFPPYTSEEYHRFGGHVWIYFDGHHYDAENPEGVSDWKELSYFKREQNHSTTAGVDGGGS